MSELSNLDILTDKVYREGIEKAEHDAKEIRSQAEAERKRILDQSRQEAEKTIAEAKREAERITRTVENELQLKGQQFISDLKTQIHNTLAEKILDKPATEAFENNAFVQSAILEAINSWDPASNLEILLPKNLENKLGGSFDKEVRKRAKNLTIDFDQQLTTGFRISEQGKGYQISFSEDDFIALFTPYLQLQTQRLLFNTPE